MDRFIRGEDVAPASLRRAWQDTTQPARLGAASFWDYYPRPLVVGPDGKPTTPVD
jgi:hypothetical protein